MRPTFSLQHFRKSSFTPPDENCFTHARLGNTVAVRDDKNDRVFGTTEDITFWFTAERFDAFLSDVLGCHTTEAFLSKTASGTLTEHCFITELDAEAHPYPYIFRNVDGEAGELRFSAEEMIAFYLGVRKGEFKEDTVSADERVTVLV